MKLEGVILPVTTPFDGETGELAPVSFRENLRKWLSAGVSGFVVAGSTGEAALVDEDEIVQLLGWARDIVPPDRLLIAGAGRESTRATVRLCRAVAECGADAVLVRPPAYYPKAMDPDTVRRHFEKVADSIPIPLILYHVPQFVPVEIAPGSCAELCTHHNIIGIKDSTGDLKSLGAFLDVVAGSDNCRVMVGAGSKLYAALELGAAGGIVAVGCIAPRFAVDVYRSFCAGDMGSAGKAQSVLTGLHNAIVRGTGVAGVKYALDLLGYNGGDPRPPLRPPDERVRATIRDALGAVELL